MEFCYFEISLLQKYYENNYNECKSQKKVLNI